MTGPGTAIGEDDKAALLRHLFDVAVESAQPSKCIPPFLPPPPEGRTIIIGAGKAAAAMAQAVEQCWNGPVEGVVVTRYGHGVPCDQIEVREAGHPIPDDASISAAEAMLQLLQDVTEKDLVLCLLSGGGSSLLTLPPPGISLHDVQRTFTDLLHSGASIAQINCVRKHISGVAGGRLMAAAKPARLVTLAISDVPGDDIATIASGPTVADPTTRSDALAVFEQFNLSPQDSIRRWLESEESETPKPGISDLGTYHLVASPQMAIEAAAMAARDLGYTPLILGSAIEGDARQVAIVHAGIAQQVVRYGQPAPPPCILLSGGETTVAVSGHGRGGRNGEFLMSLAHALAGETHFFALAADTDGIDGMGDNAGAFLGPSTIARAESAGTSLHSALEDNDSYGFFEAAGTLVHTGPTLTNVNDFRAILIERAAPRGKLT